MTNKNIWLQLAISCKMCFDAKLQNMLVVFFGQFECFAVFVNMGALCSSGS